MNNWLHFSGQGDGFVPSTGCRVPDALQPKPFLWNVFPFNWPFIFMDSFSENAKNKYVKEIFSSFNSIVLSNIWSKTAKYQTRKNLLKNMKLNAQPSSVKRL